MLKIFIEIVNNLLSSSYKIVKKYPNVLIFAT